jgi:hypothetical protein
MRTTRRAAGDQVNTEPLGNEAGSADEQAAPMVSPLSPQEIALIDTDALRARQYAAVLEEARSLGTSSTIPGGRYLVNGEWVNAYGDKINPETGDVIERRYTPPDASFLR